MPLAVVTLSTEPSTADHMNGVAKRVTAPRTSTHGEALGVVVVVGDVRLVIDHVQVRHHDIFAPIICIQSRPDAATREAGRQAGGRAGELCSRGWRAVQWVLHLGPNQTIAAAPCWRPT